jgi:hypothetical protein
MDTQDLKNRLAAGERFCAIMERITIAIGIATIILTALFVYGIIAT